jgi:hypothetical protein
VRLLCRVGAASVPRRCRSPPSMHKPWQPDNATKEVDQLVYLACYSFKPWDYHIAWSLDLLARPRLRKAYRCPPCSIIPEYKVFFSSCVMTTAACVSVLPFDYDTCLQQWHVSIQETEQLETSLLSLMLGLADLRFTSLLHHSALCFQLIYGSS